MLTIRSKEMIAAIIDYLDLPISKNATELRYYGKSKAFIIYGEYGYDCESVQVDCSIDVTVDYWGGISLELFSFDRSISTLILEPDNFKISRCYNFAGYLRYGNFYIASLD